jgi:hypothetical protein
VTVKEKPAVDRGSPHGALWSRSRELAARTAGRLERTISTTQPDLRQTNHGVAAVLVAWDPVASRRCAHEMVARLRRVSPRARLVLVDNRGAGMEWATEEGFEIVVGDNSAREFTGLQSGVSHVRRLASPAVWVLANDRYLSDNEPSLHDLDGGTIDAVVATNAVAGRINCYPTTSRAFGLDIGSWARSNFLVVADDALHQLSPLAVVRENELDSIVGPVRGERPLLRSDGPLDGRHASYVTEWVTGEGSDLDQHWYRHQPVSSESWDELIRKVQCILNEQLLSARARDVGIPVLPMHLAHSMGQLDPASTMYRSMVRIIRQRPVEAIRWLKGTVGRDLFALQAWRDQRRLADGPG